MNLEGNNLKKLQKAPVKESIEDSVFGVQDPDYNHSDFSSYRRLTGGSKSPSDLDPMVHERMQSIALLLFKINPMAKRILQMTASFAVGGSLMFEAENNRVHKILQDHWDSPVNLWDRKLYQYIFEIGLYGELFLTTKVNDMNGDVTLGYLSPLRVKSVRRDDKGVLTHVMVRSEQPGEEDMPMKIINYVTDPNDPSKGFREGEIFYWKVNSIGDSTRGVSDLLALADYMDGLDQFLFNLLERSGHQNMWLWDVKLEGATEQDIDKWLTSFQAKPPRPGSIRAHNERVEWTPLAPVLGGQDNAEHIRLFKSYILGGAGYAEWMFGESGSAGRAVASEMLEPTLRALKTRQKEAKYIIEDVFNFVIDQKLQANELPNKRLDRRFYISMPAINLRDFSRTTQALFKGAQAIQTLIGAQSITPERAARITNELLNQLELDGDYDRAHKEVATNATARAANPNDPNATPQPAEGPKKKAPAAKNGTKPETKATGGSEKATLTIQVKTGKDTKTQKSKGQ